MMGNSMRTSALLAIVLLMLPGLASAANFTALGDLPGGAFSSSASGISDDGTVVVGTGLTTHTRCTPSYGGSCLPETLVSGAFRWTAADGMSSMGSQYQGSSAVGISGNGAVAFGTVCSFNSYQSAYCERSGTASWTEGMQSSFLSNSQTVLSQNSMVASSTGEYRGGTVLLRDGQGMGPNLTEPVIWSNATGTTNLVPEAALHLNNVNYAGYGGSVYWVSDDGNTALADFYSTDSVYNYGAFKWTREGGMQQLAHSGGNAVSTDGSILVGETGQVAYRWTEGSGYVYLGALAGGDGHSEAFDLSSDGSVVVGKSNIGHTYEFVHQGVTYLSTNYTDEAFYWTADSGMQRLFDVLVAQGVTGLSGWTLSEARGVSADGLTIVGTGVNPLGQTEAFVANISPVPIPPAVWLFGSALGLMGVLRRKQHPGIDLRGKG